MQGAEQDQPRERVKRLKRSDIRHFMQTKTVDQAEQTCTDVMQSDRAEQPCRGEMLNGQTEHRCMKIESKMRQTEADLNSEPEERKRNRGQADQNGELNSNAGPTLHMTEAEPSNESDNSHSTTIRRCKTRMMKKDAEGELNLGEDIPFNNIITNISTCSQSIKTITQSATIQAAVARYDKFRLYPNYVPMLTHYNPGNQAIERGQAEQQHTEGEGQAEQRSKKEDQAGHSRVGGCQAEQQHTEGGGQAQERDRAEHQPDQPEGRDLAEQEEIPMGGEMGRAEPQHRGRRMEDQAGNNCVGGCHMVVDGQAEQGDDVKIEERDQAEQRREQSSTSTITITQSATKQAAVARYDNVPIIKSCVMSLTSHNPGTTAEDEILGRAEQEEVPRVEEMDRAEHQTDQPEGRGQDEQWREQSSQSILTITQSATIQAAVARYDDVPIVNSCVMSLTSHNSGTPTNDEMLGQDEQEEVLRNGKMDRAEHQPGLPKERGQAEQEDMPRRGDIGRADHLPRDIGRADHQPREGNARTDHQLSGGSRGDHQSRDIGRADHQPGEENGGTDNQPSEGSSRADHLHRDIGRADHQHGEGNGQADHQPSGNIEESWGKHQAE